LNREFRSSSHLRFIGPEDTRAPEKRQDRNRRSLVLACGTGAGMRQALGTAVFYGMIGVTLFGLLFTPIFYVVMRRVAGDRSRPKPARIL
jgi:hypothetical protein